mmetsp:Transcript_6090/g.19211  ORF Transcript_6090/g.19211 Transcript_6090/m.19211 type:complete len:344 (-) Transcript_6090:177-1208(-)
MKLREMNDWKISNDTLKLGVELGRGSFGIVMAAEWRHTPVALKILFADAQADDKTLFEKEVRMMATLHHPNIVQFLGYARTPALTLVIELFPEGSVERFVPREKPGQKTSLRFCIDMALAIEYLHSRQPSIVIHRDIKPANFLLTASLRVKLGDFGIARTRQGAKVDRNKSCESLATMLDSSMHGVSSLGSMQDQVIAEQEISHGDDLTSNCGTVRFMAPEVAAVDGARTQTYDQGADVFSLAMVYYFVWERVLPAIPECNKPPLHLAALRAGKRPTFSRTPKPIRELINHMWRLEPEHRPKASDVLDYLYNIKHKPTFGGGVLKVTPPPGALSVLPPQAPGA